MANGFMVPAGGGGGRGNVGAYIETITIFYTHIADTSDGSDRNSIKVLTEEGVSNEYFRHDGGTIYEDSYVKVDYRGDHTYPYMYFYWKVDLYVMTMNMGKKNDRRPILYSAGTTTTVDPPHDGVSEGFAIFEIA